MLLVVFGIGFAAIAAYDTLSRDCLGRAGGLEYWGSAVASVVRLSAY